MHYRRFLSRLASAAVLTFVAFTGVSAQTADEAAARFAELQVKVKNQPVSVETLGEVQSLSFGSAIAPRLPSKQSGTK